MGPRSGDETFLVLISETSLPIIPQPSQHFNLHHWATTEPQFRSTNQEKSEGRFQLLELKNHYCCLIAKLCPTLSGPWTVAPPPPALNNWVSAVAGWCTVLQGMKPQVLGSCLLLWLHVPTPFDFQNKETEFTAFCFLVSFQFYIGVQLINDVVMLPGAQQRPRAMYPFSPEPPPFRGLPHNMEHSSLC